jgi:hypothetical protein
VYLARIINRIGRLGIGAALAAATMMVSCGETALMVAAMAALCLLLGSLVERLIRSRLRDSAREAYLDGGFGLGDDVVLVDGLPLAGAVLVSLPLYLMYQGSPSTAEAAGMAAIKGVAIASLFAGGLSAVHKQHDKRLAARLAHDARVAAERQAQEQRAQEERRRTEEAAREREEAARAKEEEARKVEERRQREADERALALRRAEEIAERARQRDAEEMASLVQGANLFAGGNAKQTLTVKKQIGGSEVVFSAEYDPHAAEHAERHAQMEALQRKIEALAEREENNRQAAQIERDRDRFERDRQEWSYRQGLQAIADRAERIAAEQQHQIRVLQDQAEIDRRRQALDRGSDQLRREREDVQRQRDDLAREIKAAEERAAFKRKIDELTSDNERLKARDDAQQQLQQQLRDIPESQW